MHIPAIGAKLWSPITIHRGRKNYDDKVWISANCFTERRLDILDKNWNVPPGPIPNPAPGNAPFRLWILFRLPEVAESCPPQHRKLKHVSPRGETKRKGPSEFPLQKA